jgi:hypothetical protein
VRFLPAAPLVALAAARVPTRLTLPQFLALCDTTQSVSPPSHTRVGSASAVPAGMTTFPMMLMTSLLPVLSQPQARCKYQIGFKVGSSFSPIFDSQQAENETACLRQYVYLSSYPDIELTLLRRVNEAGDATATTTTMRW